MVVSHTKKESIAIAKSAVEITARLLGEWTQRQVQQASINDRTPYIWPLGAAGYIIGNRKVMSNKGYWAMLNTYNETQHIFDSKLSAVFYCLCDQTGKYRLAQNIKTQDVEVMRLKNDIVHYQSSVNRAIRNKKSDAAAIWEARLFDARLRLKTANDQLQKSLTSAKYIKYWE